jgi:hypothetical protein
MTQTGNPVVHLRNETFSSQEHKKREIRGEERKKGSHFSANILKPDKKV